MAWFESLYLAGSFDASVSGRAAAWLLIAPVVLFAMLEGFLPRPAGVPPVGGRRHLVNFGLGLSGLAVQMLFPLGSVTAALLAQRLGWGLAAWGAQGWQRVIVCLAAVPAAVAAHSFALYWLHRAMHAVPLLWRVHRVHHADRALDLSTAFRHHPLEAIVTLPVRLGVVLALGLPVWAALAADGVMLAGSLLKHMDARLPPGIDRALGLVLATPRLHRLHHSVYPAETDSNFGNTLIVWDRLFGTLRLPSGALDEASPGRIGLGAAHDAIADSLPLQLLLPLREPPARLGCDELHWENTPNSGL